MTSRNDILIEILNFTLNSDLSLIYKKVYLKKYVNEYLNDSNKEDIINIIKNNNIDIYNYIFLDKNDKNKLNYNKNIDNQRKYREEHKEELKEKRKIYYQKHREEKIQKVKEYQLKKKEINNPNE